MPRLALAFALTATLLANPASAALSGYHDSAAKIAAILASPQVADALRQMPVRSVENTGTAADGADEWTVRTQDCDLAIKVTAHPPADGMVGMTSYTAEPLGSCN